MAITIKPFRVFNERTLEILDLAMSRAGFTEDHLRLLSNETILLEVFRFLEERLGRDSGLSPAQAVDIDPQKAMKLPHQVSASRQYLQPAKMKAKYVEALLEQFEGRYLEALRFILIKNKNEPVAISHELNSSLSWLGTGQKNINDVLKPLTFDGRSFSLLHHRMTGLKPHRRVHHCQLWEVKYTPVAPAVSKD